MLVALPVSDDECGVDGQVMGANSAIVSQTQGHGPGISTGAMQGEKRQADQVNIIFWRSS